MLDGARWSIHMALIATVLLVLQFFQIVASRSSAIPFSDKKDSWRQTTENLIETMEYIPSAGKNGLQSPNRAHNFRIYYTKNGIQVHDRTRKDEPLLLAMRLSEYGRTGNLKTVPKIEPHLRKNKVSYQYDSVVSEWYINSKIGLENGFDVAKKLPGSGPITFKIELSGAQAYGSDKEGISMHTSSGRILNYDKLTVYDANDNIVPARMNGVKSNIILSINDEDAIYPLTIDPLLTGTRDSIVIGQGHTDRGFGSDFGISSTNAGDVNGDGYEDLLVGAPEYDSGENNEGAGFIYYGSETGISSNNKTHLQINIVSAYFGSSVAAAGDLNGDGFDDVLINGADSTYIYYGSSEGISNSGLTTARSGSISGAGDVNGDGYSDVIIGQPSNYYAIPGGGSDNGEVFIYHGGPLGLSRQYHTRLALDQDWCSVRCSNFGSMVSSTGDINGDGFDDVMVTSLVNNSVYVYLGSVNGIVPNLHVRFGDDQIGSGFGRSLASAGDINGDGFDDIIIGAPSYPVFCRTCLQWFDMGRAYVYHGSSQGFVGAVRTILESNDSWSRFGRGVSSLGDVNADGYADIIVGSPNYNNLETDEGAVFIYYGGKNSISTTADVILESNSTSSLLGFSVSGGDVNGDGYDDLLVGAPFVANAGAVYVYHGGATGVKDSTKIEIQSDQANSEFSFSVANAGDINGDGFGDVIIGAPSFDNGETDEGAVFIFLGSNAGLNPSADQLLELNLASTNFGLSVSGAGDINGDGFADIITSSLNNAYVFYGSSAGLESTAIPLNGVAATAPYGATVSGAGDVNADGFADVLVGAYTLDSGTGSESSIAMVFHGSDTGVRVNPATQLIVDQNNSLFGHSLSGAGDLNGDGFSDVAIGASRFDNGELNEGAVFVYYGGATGISIASRQMIEINHPGSEFGASLSGAGDVNADGFDDLVVGAPFYFNVEANEGAAFVYHGSASGLSAQAAVQLEVNQTSASFGNSVSGIGDTNGDGYDDIIVGAILYDNMEIDEGAVFVFQGSAMGVNPVATEQFESNQVGARFGISVSGAGDINADGYSDIIVGADGLDRGQVDEGLATIYFGNAGSDNLPTSPRQFRQNTNTNPVSPLGGSYSSTQYTVSMTGKHYKGRGAIKLQVETCPHTDAFGSSTCTLSTQANWSLSTNTSIVLTQVMDVAKEGSYKWRARILYADERVLKPGITARQNPKHGPWRRLQARTGNLDIRVTNYVNDAPIIQSGTGSFTVPENIVTGSILTTIVANDADGTVPTLSLSSGNESGHFEINSTGEILVATPLDFESIQYYTLTVTASDGQLSVFDTVNINLENINDNAPVIHSGSGTFSISDSTPVNTVVNTLNASDADGNNLIYNITQGNEAGDFAINSSGELIVAQALNFMTTPSYQFVVTASDGTFFDEVIVSVELLSQNAPEFTNTQWTHNIPEDTPIGTLLTTLQATDINQDTLSYQISQGNESGTFSINSTTGDITLAGALDFESVTQYVLTVTVSDGSNTTQNTLTVNITDIVELPVFTNTNWTFSLPENTAIGTPVTTLTAIDPNNETLVYNITSGNDAGDFAINTDTGSITVAQNLDFVILSNYSLTVTASAGTRTVQAVVTISITDVVELPEFTNTTWSFSLPEDTTIGTVVTTLTAIDPNSEILVYNITSGNNSGDFAINNETGRITVSQNLDFENLSNYNLTVTATAGTRTVQAIVTISITDVVETVPEPPSEASGNSDSGGGSMAWSLFVLLLLIVRRTIGAKFLSACS